MKSQKLLFLTILSLLFILNCFPVACMASAPGVLKLDVDVIDIKLGMQDQPGGSIILNESIAGAIRSEGEGLIWIRIPDSVKGVAFTNADVEVIDGNMEIDESSSGVATNGREIRIYVTGESVLQTSKIIIDNIRITTDRTVPEGVFKLEMGGDALFDDLTDIFAERHNYVDFTYGNLVTPAPADNKQSIIFYNGKNNYTKDSFGIKEDFQFEGAPFLVNGRIFIPLRVAAEVLGVKQILWQENENEVLLEKGNHLVKFEPGKKVMFTNGMEIPLEDSPVIVAERMYIPASYLATALGYGVTWNTVNESVSFSIEN